MLFSIPKYWLRVTGYGLLSIFLLSSFLLMPSVAHAQGLIPCAPWNRAPDANPNDVSGCSIGALFTLLVNIYNFLLGMAAIVLIIIIIVGGIGMLTYHYFENPESVLEKSKYTVTRGIAGFVIIAMAYLIVNTVMTLLGVQNPGDFFGGGFLGG